MQWKQPPVERHTVALWWSIAVWVFFFIQGDNSAGARMSPNRSQEGSESMNVGIMRWALGNGPGGILRNLQQIKIWMRIVIYVFCLRWWHFGGAVCSLRETFRSIAKAAYDWTDPETGTGTGQIPRCKRMFFETPYTVSLLKIHLV